ncbi:PEP-CTERM sorting domain-containing protein [Desulfobacter sp.]|uniref:PEP-CTERM sorting domain-containing protein n=1 Tax=Desulfobacter sp. TaxID=2294 RepID=UPI00257E0335|nr:PEP-CTERM sorting domain-containing protein [Desulfobacter sp.]
MIVKLIKPIAVSFLVLFFTLPVCASTITVNEPTYGYGKINVYYNGNVKSGLNAGMFPITYNGFDTWGFCVDLDYAVTFGENWIDGEISISGNYLYVEWLVAEFASDLYEAALSNKDIASEATALQLAIWEVRYDNVWDWDYDETTLADEYFVDPVNPINGTGLFYYDRTKIENSTHYKINDFYDDYINALTKAVNSQSWSSFATSGDYSVFDLSKNGASTQDIIVKVVPEPTTALLLGFGLLGLCAVGRKKA